MKVDYDQKVKVVATGSSGRIEAEPEVAGGVNYDIRGYNPIDGFFRRRFEVDEVEETAADGDVGTARDVHGKGEGGEE